MPEGYTLMQMIQRVRQVLRPGDRALSTPVVGAQGLTVTQMITRVRRILRDDASSDSDRFIPDAEITDWVNDSIVEMGDRTQSVRRKASGTVATTTITIPSDALRVTQLMLVGKQAQRIDDDDEWFDWVHQSGTVPRPIWRIAEANIEIYPTQGGAAYELHYVARPYTFTSSTDNTKSDLPYALQVRVIHMARAMALYKEMRQGEGDRHMQLAQQGLDPGTLDVPTEKGEAPTWPRWNPVLGEPREVEDYEIIDFINEGLLEIAWRELPFEREESEVVGAGDAVPLPDDFLKLISLRLSVSGEDGYYNVESVPSDTFGMWKFNSENAVPAHRIMRVFSTNLEVYPSIPEDTTYYLRYHARPALLVLANDRPDLPIQLQERVINFARAQALWSVAWNALDMQRADRYFQMFAAGLNDRPIIERLNSGPLQLLYEDGPFDVAEAKHR
jgi:hypothetical protein